VVTLKSNLGLLKISEIDAKFQKPLKMPENSTNAYEFNLMDMYERKN